MSGEGPADPGGGRPGAPVRRLPVAEPGPAAPPTGEPPTGPAPPEVPSRRLVSTLAAAGIVAGLAIVFVHRWAEPRIQAHRAAVLREAIQEVLRAPRSHRTLFLENGALSATLPPGTDSAGLDRVYIGYDAAGRPVGFAVAGEAPGYQDLVRLLFGYDPATGRVLGMKVLDSRETPGLGDKILHDTAFIAEFAGALPPLVGVRQGRGTGDEHEVDMISGATISSRTVIRIINDRLAALKPLLDAYREPAAGEGMEARGTGARTGAGGEARTRGRARVEGREGGR